MPTYHLNLFDDLDIRDDEGAEYASLDLARMAALRGARGLMSDYLMHGMPIELEHRIEITDERGEVLAVVRFADAITIRQGRTER